MAEGTIRSGGNTIRYSLRAPQLFAHASQFRAEWQRAVITALTPVAERVKRQAQQAYSGTRFAPAFVVQRQSTPFTAVRLFNTHALFNVVEYPTQAHLIRPHGRFLVFTVGGRKVFAREVHHPGTRGRLAIDRIFQDAETDFTNALISATGAMLNA